MAVYDADNDQVVLFGGEGVPTCIEAYSSPNGYLAETWKFRLFVSQVC